MSKVRRPIVRFNAEYTCRFARRVRRIKSIFIRMSYNIKYLQSLLAVLLVTFQFVYAGPHTVQKGESMTQIAKLYGIPVDSLINANPDSKAYSGVVLEIPLVNSLCDLGHSGLFRRYRLSAVDKTREGEWALKKARRKMAKSAYDTQAIVNYYEKAVSCGNVEALRELGSYYVHGYSIFRPSFENKINGNVEQFLRGVELLQISSFVEGDDDALADLIVAYGHIDSPIRDVGLTIRTLENYKTKYHKELGDYLYYMYENGYGVDRDYIKAYIHCPTSDLLSKSGLSERERILERIDTISNRDDALRYGVGLEADSLFALGLNYYNDGVLKPEGLFWIHRAAHLGDAEANWTLSKILSNEQTCRAVPLVASKDQSIAFARTAADLGNRDAMEYIEAYDKYVQEKERRERERMLEIAQKERERKEQRTQAWLGFAGSLVQVAAQTYAAVQMANNQGGQYYGYNNNYNNNYSTNLDYLADPNYAVAQVAAQERAEYESFTRYNKKPDGSDYTMLEWRALQGEAILKMKEEGYDFIAERQKMIEENRAFEEELSKDEMKKRLEAYKIMNSKDLGVSANSSVSATASGGGNYKPVASKTNAKPVSASVRNESEQIKRNDRKTDAQDKDLDSKQQFKTGKVSSDDYQFVRHITLYIRTNNLNKIMFNQKDLCKKGAYYFVKIDKTYFRVNPNGGWGFNRSISYGHDRLYFNM